MTRLHSWLVAGLVVTGGGALAADLPTRKAAVAPVAAPAACEDKAAAPTDAFGFGSGAAVAQPGERAIGLEYSGGYGTRGGPAQAHGLKAQASFGVLPRLEVGPSVFYGWSRASDRAAGTVSTSRAFGAGIEVKYKLFSGDGFGVTAVIEPTYAWNRARFADPATPLFLRGDGPIAGATAKLLIDRTLIEDVLFAAFNLEQGAAFLKDNGVDCATANGSGWCRSSSLTARAALAVKAASWEGGGLYLGVDAAHQRAYDGAFLNRRPGWAWFAGPSLLAQVNDKVSVNAAWSTQLRGRAAGQASGALNLDDFTRHIAKAKLAVAF